MNSQFLKDCPLGVSFSNCLHTTLLVEEQSEDEQRTGSLKSFQFAF